MENSFESGEEDEEAGICYDFTKKTWRDDVTFIVEGQHLHATKAILAMDSPVFEAMFGTSFRERDEKEVPLPGKKYEDFEEFLHCIYPKSKKKINTRNVYKVLPLADEYDVI
ncbi:BTB and MATH domain-containing protein 38-like [Mercenaria mercenaria]|uniref:BTB and MATH domain-containing protein 38-like n=1 Tax=Mercenaria mercenaria TaxID=6596 RepID=UPI00234E57F1|nr:BTB and MATH domain-containing protein 38-like [Mercenaria mercenaria]